MKHYKDHDAIVIKDVYSKDWKQSNLLMSDIHFDSKKCNRILLKKHLEEAKEKNANIFMFGDIFDCMGGKYDKRTTKSDIRQEYQTQTYFQDIVKDAAKFFMPYADYIVLLSDGNHETSIKQRHEIDLLDDLAFRLDRTGEQVLRGKYNGFINFRFELPKTGASRRKIMYYTHGGGGAAPVTRGAIKSNRRQDMIIADYYVGGHIHMESEIPRPQASITIKNVLKIKDCYHWGLGCYKDEFGGGGWADHKEFAPASIGGRWLEHSYYGDEIITKSYLAK